MSLKHRPIQNFRGKEKEPLEPEYAKLVKSLYSGLPNEVDFVFNLLTLMVAPGPHSLKLEKCPLLLSLIIAHCGVYGDNETLKKIAEEGWNQFIDQEFEEFWLASGVKDEDILAMVPISSKKLVGDRLIDDIFTNEMAVNPKNPTFYRVCQAAAHLRNMSFEHGNVYTMGKSDILIQFMTICASTKHVMISREALDTLSNISTEIDLLTVDGDYMHCMMLKVIAECLVSDDKQRVLQGLQIIGGLCQNERNELVCVEFVDSDMMSRMFKLTTLKDILICIYTLECLYQFSELGRSACNRIASHSTAINQLISLITVEAASFGKSGLSGIQVVENFPQNQSRQHYPVIPNQQQQQPQFRQPYPPSQHPYGPPSNRTTPAQRPLQQRVVIQQQVAITSDEKLKHLTSKWIRENCVAEHGATAIRGDLYSNYVDYMKSAHGIMSGSVQMFTSILQSLFNCSIKNEQRDSTMVYLIEGVKFLRPQGHAQVAASHPVMQKILATPKASPVLKNAPVSMVPDTNGHAAPVLPAPLEPTKIVSNGVHPKVEETDKPKVLEAEEKREDEPMEVDTPAESTSTIPIVNGVAEENIVVAQSAKLEICSAAVEAKSLLPKEEHETPIIKVEVIKEQKSKDIEKTVNGLIKEAAKVINEEMQHEQQSLSNGDCNGISDHHREESSDSKENGSHDEHQNGVTESTSGEIITDDEEHLNEERNKIDESIDSTVRKLAPKNGLRSRKAKTDAITEVDREPIANGNNDSSTNDRKRKRNPSKTPTKKPRKNDQYINVDSIPDGAVMVSVSNSDVQLPSTSSGELMCEWDACGQMFASTDSIMAHHLVDHLSEAHDEQYVCLWPTCDGTRRGKWSLVTHIQDHHCQEHILRQAIQKRNEMGGNVYYLQRIKQQLQERPKESMNGIPFAATAASEAIRRHAYVNVQREVIDETEGPVTKCIRLTAALILRNIARYSEEGRAQIKPYEFRLSPFAISRLEAGTTLAQCLAELHPKQLKENDEGEQALQSHSFVTPSRRHVPVKIAALNKDLSTRY